MFYFYFADVFSYCTKHSDFSFDHSMLCSKIINMIRLFSFKEKKERAKEHPQKTRLISHHNKPSVPGAHTLSQIVTPTPWVLGRGYQPFSFTDGRTETVASQLHMLEQTFELSP